MMINKLFMGCRGLLKYIFDRKAGSENVPVAERKIFYVSLLLKHTMAQLIKYIGTMAQEGVSPKSLSAQLVLHSMAPMAQLIKHIGKY